MANMVEITEARFFELLKREETLDAYRKAYGEMQKERDEWKEQAERERDWRLGMLKEIETTGRGIAIESDAAERCIDDIQKELSKAEAGNSIGNVKAALQIIRKYRKAKEVR